MEHVMEKIVSLTKRRGFIFPGSEVYGGLAGTWDFGPLGVELAENIKHAWWKMFVSDRDDMFGVKSSILMNAKAWEASGHTKNFIDPMVDCKKCKMRFRADTIDPTRGCPECGAHDFTEARPFNTMFKTHIGPVENTAAQTYLRPETAQGMFINFKHVVDTMRPSLPFGIAQIGKAFRNEITPGNFIFRTREFEQMEIEYFVRPNAWEKYFEEWLARIQKWASAIGIGAVYEREVAREDRAHYSRRTVDIDFDFPFGREELYGIAYRADFDLNNHSKYSGHDLSYYDDATKERIVPHVIEPTFGVERTILALLCSAYREDGERTVLAFKPAMAPVKVAVFPLLRNKPALVERARDTYTDLKRHGIVTAWDDRGNIGKRYFSQDEIGTPWCVTIDFQTLKDGTATVRDRDTMQQERVATKELAGYFNEKLRV